MIDPRHAAALWLAAALVAARPAAAVPDYRIEVAPDLRTLSVEACFATAPAALQAGDRAARRYLRDLRWLGNVEAPAPRLRRNRVTLDGAPPGSCIAYSVDVGRGADDRALGRSAWRGGDLLTTPELWLWAPDGPHEIEFVLPPGIRVSAPWPPRDASGRRFVARATPVRWAAQVAIGRLRTQELAIGRSTLHLALADAEGFDNPDDIVAWIADAAAAIATVYGRFPRATAQVLVVPGEYGGRAVPWGQVLRGGAPAAHFFVDRRAAAAPLRADWTAFHELSHLLVPFVRRSDAFASEGLASYFQNLTRGRSGNLTPEQAWTQLYRGYQRGQDGAGDETLAGASRTMHRTHNYMRVYWSGAALALMADVQLRIDSGGREGLDTVLAKLSACCLDEGEAWSAQRLFRRLDELAGSEVFGRLLRRYRDDRAFPDVFPLLGRLGVRETDGRVHLDDDAPLAQVRRAIMRAAPSPPVLRAARGCAELAAAAPDSTFVLLDPATDTWLACDPARARTPYLPASTFKVPHALIALATGAVSDPQATVSWDGLERRVPAWNRDTSLASGLRNSTVWFYQGTARAIGHRRMREWVARLGYGNADIGPPDEIRHFWLDGSLRISALEQVAFLDRLRRRTLPAPPSDQARVAQMMVIEPRAPGATLHAKSGAVLAIDPGSGDLSDAVRLDGRVPHDERVGWYVGWVARPEASGGDRVFALNLDLRTDDALRQRARLARDLLDANGVNPGGGRRPQAARNASGMAASQAAWYTGCARPSSSAPCAW